MTLNFPFLLLSQVCLLLRSTLEAEVNHFLFNTLSFLSMIPVPGSCSVRLTVTYVNIYDVYRNVSLVAGCTDELGVGHHHVLHLPPRHRKSIEAPDRFPSKDMEVVCATTEKVVALGMECYRS